MGEKVSVDGLTLCLASSKVIAVCLLVFVYLKSQYVKYYKNPKDTVWDSQRFSDVFRGYSIKRDVKHTHSLFVDDLKAYQESHKTLKVVNEMIVQTSNNTGGYYQVAKCDEIIFERGKMVKVKVCKC